MARALDDDLANPAVRHLMGDPSPSRIAQERELPGPPNLVFIALAGVLGLLVFLAGLLLSGRPIEPGEAQWADRFPLWDLVGLTGGRVVAAACGGLAVGAVATIGRRLGHSDWVGLLAATLVGLDPSLLLSSRLAIPDTFTLAGLLWGLAFFLTPSNALRWVGAGALGLAALAEPAVLLWAVPLAFLLVLRGHIYASPQHLGIAALQGAAGPAVGALVHWLLAGRWRSVPTCLDSNRFDVLLLRVTAQPGPDTALLHGPVTWLAGAGILVLAGGGALLLGLLRFRLARAPGRFQARLVVPFHPFLGRALWLLVLAVLAPTPLAWLASFALALALGTLELADDARVFGAAIGVALVGFAVLVLVGSWGAITGDLGPAGAQRALDWVPWTNGSVCH